MRFEQNTNPKYYLLSLGKSLALKIILECQKLKIKQYDSFQAWVLSVMHEKVIHLYSKLTQLKVKMEMVK